MPEKIIYPKTRVILRCFEISLSRSAQSRICWNSSCANGNLPSFSNILFFLSPFFFLSPWRQPVFCPFCMHFLHVKAMWTRRSFSVWPLKFYSLLPISDSLSSDLFSPTFSLSSRFPCYFSVSGSFPSLSNIPFLLWPSSTTFPL